MNTKVYMPPEWEEHEGTIIQWPVRESLVYEENYEEVCQGYAEVVKAISEFEKVYLIINPGEKERVKKYCEDFCEYVEIPHNDAWARDSGPIFVKDEAGKRYGVNFKFNAWGEKYTPYDLDDKFAGRFLEYLGVPKIDAPMVLEGGSVHVDGCGTLLSTKECLLNKNRNPQLSQAEIEENLKKYLGISHIIWLERGLFGDETDGHIDNISCFAKEGVVLLQYCPYDGDPNFEITNEAYGVLQKAKDSKNNNLEVIKIQSPPMRLYNGKPLTLSYLNFYLVNGGVILPTFGGDAEITDILAYKTLSGVFPDRKIKCIDGMKLIKEGGNVHCITMQIPKE